MLKNKVSVTSLAAQWLRIHLNVGDMGSVPVGELIAHMPQGATESTCCKRESCIPQLQSLAHGNEEKLCSQNKNNISISVTQKRKSSGQAEAEDTDLPSSGMRTVMLSTTQGLQKMKSGNPQCCLLSVDRN